MTEEEVLLTETEEECVHTHGVHTEEPMGDEVGADHHSLVRTSDTHFIHESHMKLDRGCCVFG